MQTMKNAEEARVWLATYEAGLRAGETIARSAEVADVTVEQTWRGRVEAPMEANVLAKQAETLNRLAREAQRRADEIAALKQRLAGAEKACADLRRLRDEALVRLNDRNKEVDLLRQQRDVARTALDDGRATAKALTAELEEATTECSMFAFGGSLAERVRQMRERISDLNAQFRELESSSADCHQDLAAVRVVLGVHNNPERSVSECVSGLVERVNAMERDSLDEDLRRAREAANE